VAEEQASEARQGQGREIVQVVVVKWKLPRIVLGLVAGLALGVAGALFQTITRNPLGSPDLIGFSTGAQTGILVSILLLPGSMLSASLASFIGGAAVGTVTYLVSLRGGFTGLRFILVGIAISSMLVSVNRWLLVRVDDDEGGPCAGGVCLPGGQFGVVEYGVGDVVAVDGCGKRYGVCFVFEFGAVYADGDEYVGEFFFEGA